MTTTPTQLPHGACLRTRSRRWAAVLALAACIVPAALVRAASPDSVPPHGPRLQDSPGWYPIVDPESSSVEIGRRVNAPVIQKPFQGGARSLDELGRAVCRMLHHSSRDSLLRLCVRDDEFRDIMWREFPESRPITGLTWEDAWISLDQRVQSGVSGALGDYGGDDWTFVRFERDSIAQYKNFKLHMRLRLVAIDDQGRTTQMRWLRSVAERRGRFKIYSTDD